ARTRPNAQRTDAPRALDRRGRDQCAALRSRAATARRLFEPPCARSPPASRRARPDVRRAALARPPAGGAPAPARRSASERARPRSGRDLDRLWRRARARRLRAGPSLGNASDDWVGGGGRREERRLRTSPARRLAVTIARRPRRRRRARRPDRAIG